MNASFYSGEEQVRNAIDIVNSANPHVVIGMGHHPFDLLRDFDRRSTQRRLEEACHYFHCGHLHVPDASMVALPSGALPDAICRCIV